MNNKKFFTIGFIIVIAAIVLISIFAITSGKDENKLDVNIYYLNPTTNKLEPEKTLIESGSEKEIFKETVEAILSGPKNTSLVSVLPKDVKILDYSLFKESNNDINARINFSREYGNLKESQELFSRASIVWTLTELNFINNVNIFIEGEPLLKSNGEAVGNLNRNNVLINPVISPDKTNTQTVTLYFSDDQANFLSPENREIEVKQSQTLETQIVEQIIAGPKNKNLYPTVPTETKIRNIKTEEGICYVDLSNDFVTKSGGGSAGETMTIYSIVNSLTELENVKKVQFLIEGEKISVFKDLFDFSKPFERNESLINAE